MIYTEDRILILDGAMGTMIQRYGLSEGDYHRGPFKAFAKDLKGNSECLNLTRPDIIKNIHKEYIDAGADIIEANTFSANRISQKEYGCEEYAAEMAFKGARIAREAADEAIETGRKVWVAGSMGPTSRSLSLSQDVSDPSFREYSFDQMSSAYKEQALSLVEGGVDMILIETSFDALNVKAALSAIQEINTARESAIPVIISVSVGDRSGRTLTGQTIEAFYTSVKHYPLLAFGLNCSLGAKEMTPLLEDISSWCESPVICYPNAGLPNEMGEYDQSPELMGEQVCEIASKGLVNIVGGCCGTTPEHISKIAGKIKNLKQRVISNNIADQSLKTSGLEVAEVNLKKRNFANIGERTNVAGSRKFARLIASGDYESALQIAAKQIEDGAEIIDINMDDAMLESAREMENFVRHISNDPSVAKAALMIDSSDWETILAGLKNAQGKSIVNSISLKEGEEAFIRKARTIKSLGAAMVVMAFDENGQATTYQRKIEICERAYRLLTEEAGVSPEDIIFDVNILSIGTGIDAHSRYAIDFIEAVRWIKSNLPGALTSGGVSNLSFAFRGNNAVREAMHSAFLYHAIKAGLDMAIVNPSMLQVYDEIEPELLTCVEDVIFDKDPQATERLMEKAAEMMSRADAALNGNSCTTVESISAEELLKEAIIKGKSDRLNEAVEGVIAEYRNAVDVIEGPLMEGMEEVGRLFADGKMFLPQVVKSAKIMKEAVEQLEPFMHHDDDVEERKRRKRIVIATVKGDVHDIGKNILGIVLTCNGFDIHDLGVMVDKETILKEAESTHADIICVSGLITPSLHQMEELCREMSSRNMDTPLFIGGATTSALHTAVKLATLYDHVFYGSDASSSAVMAKKCVMNKVLFENEEHLKQDKIRNSYLNRKSEKSDKNTENNTMNYGFGMETYLDRHPEDIVPQEISPEEVMPYFDWKMFYAIWGVKYGSTVPEAAELMQLRRDAEEEIAFGDYKIMLAARFLEGYTEKDTVVCDSCGVRFPMLRQEDFKRMSLCDFVIPKDSGRTSPFGIFAISVNKRSKAHVEGCSCPACGNRYEDMVGRTVRQTIAEAASKWLSARIEQGLDAATGIKVIKPAAGYSSCPDHTLKRDILALLEQNEESSLGIRLTESCAMTPEASICGMIFMHPDAIYPEIRMISREQYEDYLMRRGMKEKEGRQFLGYLLK